VINFVIKKIKALFKNNAYISKLDIFLKNFASSHPALSTSQLAEQEKYKRIYQLRDNKITIPIRKSFWDKF